jgi:DNA-binding NarL/FixJ family response regulator
MRAWRRAPSRVRKQPEGALGFVVGKGQLELPQECQNAVFAAWLHDQPSTNRMLIGVLSGVDDPEAVAAAYRLGARFHISKPHRFEDLVSIAQFLIQASGSDWNEAAHFAGPPEAVAAIMQGQTILPIHLGPSAL